MNSLDTLVRRWALFTALLLFAIPTFVLAEDTPTPPLTLSDALRIAHSANARLPVAQLEVEMAQRTAAEVAARQRLQLLVDGDLIYSPPNGYDTALTDSGEERLQLAAQRTLLDGGARAAERQLAGTRIGLAQARYRQTKRDVDVEVRLRFASILASVADLRAHDASIARLQAYADLLRDRLQSGQAVSADLVRTRVRLKTEEAARIELEDGTARQRMALNVLLGRPPETPLQLAPLAPPASPGADAATPWRQTPELEIARQRSIAAAADLQSAKSTRHVHVTARADLGLWGSDTTRAVPSDLGAGATFGDRMNRDAGYSVSLNFSWPIDALGAIKERIAAAELGVQQADREQTVQELAAHLQYAQARQAMTAAYRRFRLLSDTGPIARDAFLEIESRYRGGAATAQEVLDAASAELDTSLAAIQAELAYHEAAALAQRWGTD